VVASKPSEISELVRGIDDVLDQIRALDLQGISEKVKLSFDKINHKLDHADVKGVSENLTASLASMHALLSDDRWDRIVGSVAAAGDNFNTLVLKASKGLGTIESIVGDNETVIKLAIRDFGQAMARANILLERSHALIKGTDASQTQLRRHLVVVAQNLEKASEDLQRLLDVLSKHPSQLMFGEPPRPRMVEPERK
jgi:phospholipid/cholesterol/gamma-HCH transport system substrate-binding protein